MFRYICVERIAVSVDFGLLQKLILFIMNRIFDEFLGVLNNNNRS